MTNKATKLIYSYSKSILTTGLLVASFSIVIPQTAVAAPFDQKPVPTYSPVVSTDSLTTATVPANLVSQWRGSFAVPAFSLLSHADSNPNITLKSALRQLMMSLFDKQQKIPQPIVTYKFDPAAVYAWTGTIAANVNAQASEPAMKIENNRVTEFTPPQTGKALDRYDSTLKIIDALSHGTTTVDLIVRTTQPRTSLGSLNDLGINELIGRGESKFNGSPSNRRHNIKVGVAKMTGIIVKPGEIFSFNKYLGSVEAADGYLPELVIKGDKGTIPELGGGLCQVSSTAFRAAMHAGLPIVERRNHAYAVQYYSPQGSDATIYPGVVDLKWTNDTGHSILIWPHFVDDNYLIFDYYGSYDGRKVQLDQPYAYDKQSDGSMKATWTRTVTLPGQQPRHDTFNSTYQSPALFHKHETETFVSANGTTTDANGKPTTITPFVGTPPPANTNTNTSPTNSNTNTSH
ncbi:MAG TPA: VanW family protein [Patescibacteria group bacterium]|nr:VanW family protein [Patescibacteria group bacterium]